jgi:hypothetical protein
MNVRLTIEQLVLDGFPPVDRDRIAGAVEAELARLLAEHGMPAGFANGGSLWRVDGGTFEMTSHSRPDSVGVEIARRIYGGMTS